MLPVTILKLLIEPLVLNLQRQPSVAMRQQTAVTHVPFRKTDQRSALRANQYLLGSLHPFSTGIRFRYLRLGQIP